MRIAVLSLTRDRLDYTKHCFERLHDLAGVSFDHFVYDQGSQDGTADWLRDEYDPDYLCLNPENVGISKAMNALLDWAAENTYDAIVKIDNDCELVTENTLRKCAKFVVENPDWLISPRIEGLQQPPGTLEVVDFPQGRVLRKGQIGGIFLAATAQVYDSFRYDERNPVWGMDDVEISRHAANVGYLDDYVANHYLTTTGQHQDIPEYFERKKAEGLPL
jgi:GT2 family glycosyltransferase